MFDEIINKIRCSFGMNRNSQNRRYNRSRAVLNYKLLTYDDARKMIEDKKVTLIDVRSAAEFEVMHIKDAINIPVNEIEQRIFTYPQTQDLMIYCTTGTRSKSAIQILNSLGYANIFIWEYAALANFPFKDMLEYKAKT